MTREKTTIYLDPELKLLLQHLALDKDCSLSDLINEALKNVKAKPQ